MPPHETTGERILFGIVVFCIFSFKLVLSGDNVNAAAGVRIDDFLIFGALIFLFRHNYLRNISLSRPIRFYLVFVGINLFSAIWNGEIGRVSIFTAILYVLRMVEYLVFYYIGNIMAKNRRDFLWPLHWYMVMLTIVVPLQMIGLFPTTGNFSGATGRAIGNTNGPYELAAVAAFLFCYLGYIYRKRIKVVFSLGFLLLTASRITLIGVLLSTMLWLLQRARSKRHLFWAVGSAIVAVVLLLVAVPSVTGISPEDITIIKRLTSSNLTDLQSQFHTLYNLAPVTTYSEQYQKGPLEDANRVARDDSTLNGDVSGAIRLYRWTCLIKSTLDTWDSTLIGMGPSFASAAVDGYYTRVFAESGLIGLLAFLVFISVVLKDRQPGTWAFRQYSLIMIVTCMFIDIFVSYKPMMFFWLWHGMNCYWGEHLEVTSPGLTAELVTRKV